MIRTSDPRAMGSEPIQECRVRHETPSYTATQPLAHIDWLTLRFDNREVETAFTRKHAQRSVPYARVGLVLGILLYAGFGALDPFIVADIKLFAWGVRAIVVMYLGTLLALTFSARASRLHQPGMILIGPIAGGGIIAMIARASAPGSDLYYAGLLLVCTFVFSLTRLRFLAATLSAWTMVVLYEIVIVSQGSTPWHIIVSNTVFLVSITVISMAASYAGEKSMRLEFLQRRLVEKRTTELEDAHQQILRLERENTEKRMAGGFAHEIRNSLASAKMLLGRILNPSASHEGSPSLSLRNSEQLLEMFKLLRPKLDPDLARQMAVMVKAMHETEKSVDLLSHNAFTSVERSLRVTTLILEYSRVGQTATVHDPISFDAVTADVAEQYRVICDASSISLEVNLHAGATLYGSEHHIRVIIENLVLNAIDALTHPSVDPGRERLLAIETAIHEHEVVLTIRDTGIGIEEENMGRLCEAFFSTKPETGVGLGLAMADKYLSLYGGSLSAESEYLKGSAFRATLPLPRQSRSA